MIKKIKKNFKGNKLIKNLTLKTECKQKKHESNKAKHSSD